MILAARSIFPASPAFNDAQIWRATAMTLSVFSFSVPSFTWNTMEERRSYLSESFTFLSSSKKNCASASLARSTFSFPLMTFASSLGIVLAKNMK